MTTIKLSGGLNTRNPEMLTCGLPHAEPSGESEPIGTKRGLGGSFFVVACDFTFISNLCLPADPSRGQERQLWQGKV
jgi:hypothetical protein